MTFLDSEFGRCFLADLLLQWCGRQSFSYQIGDVVASDNLVAVAVVHDYGGGGGVDAVVVVYVVAAAVDSSYGRTFTYHLISSCSLCMFVACAGPSFNWITTCRRLLFLFCLLFYCNVHLCNAKVLLFFPFCCGLFYVNVLFLSCS